MGNCSFKGLPTEASDLIRIMTDSGQVLEFHGSKLVSQVINDFPRHGVFKKGELSSPLDHHEQLVAGQFYYLYPLLPQERDQSMTGKVLDEAEPIEAPSVVEVGPATAPTGVKESEMEPTSKTTALGLIESEPVRMSTSTMALGVVTRNLANGSGFEVLPPPQKGIWKVKLVINTKQLEEILSEEVNTEALIEQMRVVAASSTKAAPRRSKGGWGVKLKPIFCNVLKKVVVDDNSSPRSATTMLM